MHPKTLVIQSDLWTILEQIVPFKTRPHVLSNVLSLMSVYLRVFKVMIIIMTTPMTDDSNSCESADHVGPREKTAEIWSKVQSCWLQETPRDTSVRRQRMEMCA